MEDFKDAGSAVNSIGLQVAHKWHEDAKGAKGVKGAIGNILADALDDDLDGLRDQDKPKADQDFSDLLRENGRYREVVLVSHPWEGSARKKLLHPYQLWLEVDAHVKSMKRPAIIRELWATFPDGLEPPGQLTLMRSFSEIVARRYRAPVDFTIHAPNPDEEPGGQKSKPYAIILPVPYEMTSAGFGSRNFRSKPLLELGNRAEQDDLKRYFSEVDTIQALWSREAWDAMQHQNQEYRQQPAAVRNFKARQLRIMGPQNEAQRGASSKNLGFDDYNGR